MCLCFRQVQSGKVVLLLLELKLILKRNRKLLETEILNKKAIEASDTVRPTPDIRTGDVVEIKLEVPENRKRLSIYKGIVVSKQNAGIHTTIRIRRIIAGVGVEIVFPAVGEKVETKSMEIIVESSSDLGFRLGTLADFVLFPSVPSKSSLVLARALGELKNPSTGSRFLPVLQEMF
ncbi:hypothetical protein HAX54_009496 [Datura stramonium]|uniref:Ribosomal protein L19 n=1 Tax=Datura stramonium TaxID=4076 RepID=A0ABS8TGK1_DATST|nr:hypothetical protein [Datura stramonium]